MADKQATGPLQASGLEAPRRDGCPSAVDARVLGATAALGKSCGTVLRMMV